MRFPLALSSCTLIFAGTAGAASRISLAFTTPVPTSLQPKLPAGSVSVPIRIFLDSSVLLSPSSDDTGCRTAKITYGYANQRSNPKEIMLRLEGLQYLLERVANATRPATQAVIKPAP